MRRRGEEREGREEKRKECKRGKKKNVEQKRKESKGRGRKEKEKDQTDLISKCCHQELVSSSNFNCFTPDGLNSIGRHKHGCL